PKPTQTATRVESGDQEMSQPVPTGISAGLALRTTGATGGWLGGRRRTGAPPPRSELHRGSLLGTFAPRHSAPSTCRECHGSGGAGVTHHPEPRNPSPGADVSRVRRNQTRSEWALQDSNL